MKNKTVSGKIIDLRTKSCSAVFLKNGKKWAFAYFGSAVKNTADIEALYKQNGYYGGCEQSVYPTFGADAGWAAMDKRGALQAVHSDGALTTILSVSSVEEIPEGSGVRHLIFRHSDDFYKFNVVQHFRAVYDSDVFETWAEISNEEEGPVALQEMDSFGAEFRGTGREFHVLNLAGQWGAEAQLAGTHLDKGQTLSLSSRSGVRDAWENNAGFMVSIGGDSTETEGRVFGGALAWSGSWHAEIGRSETDLLRIRSGVLNCSGPYTLDPGKSIVLPRFVFTYSDAGRGQVSRNFHSWARSRLLPNGGKLRPVLLNSWEGAYMNFDEKVLTDMMDGVKELGGEMFVVDDGWFGLGEYARNNDTVGLGDWVWNKEKLPKGLPYLVKEAGRRGLEFGLWFEPEMANTKSDLVVKHPDWVIREKNRPLREGRGQTQVVLDMCNPAVRDDIFRQIDAILTSVPKLTYIKWDANADFMNAGSDYLPADRQGNLWFDYTNGVYELISRLRAKHPHVVFQACSSGGAHADFGFLQYADEFWGSDDTDARQRIFIQWGEMQFYPASSVACHVTAVPSHQTHRITPLKFRFDVAMSGRMGFELHPKKMAAEEVEFAKKAVVTYKRIRPVIQQGDLYRLVSPYGNDHAAIMYTDAKKDRAVVFVYGLNRMIMTDYPAPLLLKGLDPAKRYRVREINRLGDNSHISVEGEVLGGDSLAAVGMSVRLGAEYDSAVFELTAVKSRK